MYFEKNLNFLSNFLKKYSLDSNNIYRLDLRLLEGEAGVIISRSRISSKGMLRIPKVITIQVMTNTVVRLGW